MPPKKSADKPASKPREDVAARERRIGLLLVPAAVLVLVGLYYVNELVVVPKLRLNQLHVHSLQDRLTFSIRLLLPGLLTVVISVLHVDWIQLRGGAKLSNNDTALLTANRIHAVGHFVASAVNLIILATYLPEDRLKVLPLMAVTFVIGRLTFMLSSLMAPHTRSFGLVMTVIPTLGALGYNLYFMATLGLSSRLASPSIRS